MGWAGTADPDGLFRPVLRTGKDGPLGGYGQIRLGAHPTGWANSRGTGRILRTNLRRRKQVIYAKGMVQIVPTVGPNFGRFGLPPDRTDPPRGPSFWFLPPKRWAPRRVKSDQPTGTNFGPKFVPVGWSGPARQVHRRKGVCLRLGCFHGGGENIGTFLQGR